MSRHREVLLLCCLGWVVTVAGGAPAPAPAVYPDLPPGVYLTEVGVIPEAPGCPAWVEMWNHTAQPVPLRDWRLRTLQQEVFRFAEGTELSPEGLALVLFYTGPQPNSEWEKRVPPTTLVKRRLGVEAFPPYFSDAAWQRRLYPDGVRSGLATEELRMAACAELGTTRFLNEVALADAADQLVAYIWWGDFWTHLQSPGKMTRLGAEAEKRGLGCVAGLTQLYGFDAPGACVHILGPARYLTIGPMLATPGRHLKPEACVPQGTSEVKARDHELGFTVSHEGFIPSLEQGWGWGPPFVVLAYDPGMQLPVLRQVAQTVNFPPRYILVRLSPKDWQRVAGRTLYYHFGKRHNDGRELWSATQQLLVPPIKDLPPPPEPRVEDINDPPPP